jgi:putative serine protease PepD
VTRPPSLWIDREGIRDPDAGPFSQARWRRQALEAEARWRDPEEPEAPEPPPGRPRRGRFLAGLALVAALAALALSAVALLDDDGGEQTAVLPVAGGGKVAPTQIGRVYQSAGPGVVSVQVGSASGTGFVVRSDGTIVTNAHVVGDSDSAVVRFGDTGRQVQAEVRGTDASSDLAVLHVDPDNAGPLRALPLANSDQVNVGDAVVAIGHPFGLDRTATAGIVSGLGREIRAPNGFQIDKVIQTDAPINPGNSGGPLLDARGRVVGVNSQIATGGSGGSVGVGFAVPSNRVRDVLPALSRGQHIERAYLGVTTAPNVRGAEIVSIASDSPAADADLRAGDVITGIDGREVDEPDDVSRAIDSLKPGDRVRLELARDGSSRTVEVELADRP